MKSRQNISGFSLLLILLIMVITTDPGLNGQTKSRLEKERLEIIERIDYTSKLIEQKNRQKIATTEDLKLLQEQIDNRKKIIENIRKSIEVSAKLIDSQKVSQDSLLHKSQSKRLNYNKLIRMGYIRILTQNRLVFLLSSKNWGESLYRMRSMRTIEVFLKKQMKLMSAQNKKIGNTLNRIKKEQEDLQKLLEEEVININKLEEDEAQKDMMLASLESDQVKLRKDLDKQRKLRETLNREIERTILSELSGTRTGTKAAEQKVGSDSKSANSKSKFSTQKRLLPWPLEKGVIVSGFGRQKHPSLKDVIISNNGIDISSSPGSNVKAVFSGNIARVMQISENNMMVLINHGEYFTVYSKLAEVHITQGQSVEAGQSVGSLAKSGDAVLHFQIWKDKTKLDPEQWLRKPYR